MTTTPKVYTAIAAVMAEIGSSGISKDRRNQQQGYNFRGIDEVYNALSPILAKHKLCILPQILTRSVVERTTQKGGVLFYVTVEAEFDLVCAEDGSSHKVRTFGEAMDSADKATNKAMSAAYKYAAMQTFCIPTEGDNDADGQTHEVAPNSPSKAPSGMSPALATVMPPKTGFTYNEYSEAIKEAEDVGHLKNVFAMIWRDPGMSAGEKDNLKGQYERRKEKLAPKPDGYKEPSFDHLEAALEAGGAGTFKETHE